MTIVAHVTRHEEYISRCTTEMGDQLFPEGGCFKVFAVSLNGTLLAYFPNEAYRNRYAESLLDEGQ